MDFGAEPTERDLALLDGVARPTQGGGKDSEGIVAIHQREATLGVPRVILSYSSGGDPREARLPTKLALPSEEAGFKGVMRRSRRG